MSEVGHNILSAADFPKVRSELHSFPTFNASLSHWALKNRETHMMDFTKNGGLRRDEPDQAGLSSVSGNFTPPKLLSAYRAVTLRDAGNSDLSGPSTIITKLHVDWGHASATQIKRVLVDAKGDTQSRNVMFAQRDVCAT